MSVLDRKYIPTYSYTIDGILYMNGYCQMEDGVKIFIQKSLRISGFEGSYFPKVTAIFKKHKK
jgi:hypothetical protein